MPVTFFVEIGKRGQFQERGQQTKEFNTRLQADRFAKEQLKLGHAVAIDRITDNSQRPLLIKGIRGTLKKDNFGRFSPVRRKKDKFDMFGGSKDPFDFGFL